MDESLRDLERRAAQGEPGAREKLDQVLARTGHLPVVIPSLGESTPEAVVVKWHVRPGDWVKKDQPVVELETDKASVELEAPEDGLVATILVTEGTTVPIGAVLARLAPPPPVDAAVEAEHAERVARIVAAPEDEALRLAYADFLVETGRRGQRVHPWTPGVTVRRGEHIALHPRARGTVDDRSPPELRTALDLVPFPCPRPLVEGGFVVGVQATPSWLAERWERLVACAPITVLGIDRLVDPAPILRLPGLEQVRTLSLRFAHREALEALAASGRLRPRRLVLVGWWERLDLVAALGATELEVRLTDYGRSSEAVLRALVALPPTVRRVAVTEVTEERGRAALGERFVPPREGTWW